MKTTQQIYLWLIVFVLLIVQSVYAQQRISIPQPFGDDFIHSDLITKVSIIPLEIESYGAITEDMEMKADNENIFILDNRNTQCVYRFNIEGEFLNTICAEQAAPRAGNFPQLSNPARFSIDPYRKHIEIYRFETSTNFIFSYDGNAAGNFKFSVTPPDYARDTNGNYWISTGWNNSESQYRLLQTDSKGKIIDRHLRMITRCTPTESFAFHVNDNDNDISFWELLGNMVYSLKENDITPRYFFDFGDYNLPLDYHNIDGNDSFKMINQRGYYTIKRFMENIDFAYMALNFISSNQRAMFHIIHDKQNDKINVYTENAAIGLFDKAQYINNNNELLFLVSPRKVRNLFRGSQLIPKAFEDLPDKIGNTRTPVVLKIALSATSNSDESGFIPEELNSDYEN